MNDTLTEMAVESPLSDDDRDRRRIERFCGGDGSAFAEIVAAHERRVARLVYRLLGWSADVEDVVQEVFIAVLQNSRRFRGESKFSTWLTAVTVNQCRSYRRRRLLWRRREKTLIEERYAERRSDQRAEPDGHDGVRKAVRALPAKFHEPIVLRYFEQMSVSEIGDVLGLSPGAVEVRLSRARQRLKQRLERHQGEDD